MTGRLLPFAVLGIAGLSWGLTIPLTKIAIADARPVFGLILWQLAIGSVILGGLCVLRGRGLPFDRRSVRFYLAIAFLGTLIPNYFSYTAVGQLPAGIMSILIAMVPLFSMPIALSLGLERPELRRIAGIALGAAAVVLIVGPEASLPEAGQVLFVFVGLLPALFYGLEGNYIAWRGTDGLDPIQVLAGASISGAVVLAPVVFLGGFAVDIRPLGAPELAILALGLCHATAYSCYVWLVGRTGAVFASLISYVVTGSGVLWSMFLLGERYAIWVWAALGLMLLAVALVQPRPRPAEARAPG
ncbi:MAG: DMT family transporter [Pseudomonadota bacterium]